MSLAEKAAAFRALHDSFFILPNAANAGEAKRLAALGFKAVASTSWGLAEAIGATDATLGLEPTLANLAELAAATDLPVNADFQAGYAESAAGVAENVRRAAGTGIVALSIEDRAGDSLHPLETALDRLKAARAALDSVEPRLMLVGRCEAFLLPNPDLDQTVARLKAYAAAGADVLFAPGIVDPETIRAVVRAAAPRPVNVLLRTPEMTAPEMEKLGARRVSVGSGLSKILWRSFDEAAKSLAERGALPPAKG